MDQHCGDTKVFHNHWNLLWRSSVVHFDLIWPINCWSNWATNAINLFKRRLLFFSRWNKHRHNSLSSSKDTNLCAEKRLFFSLSDVSFPLSVFLMLNFNCSIPRVNCLSSLVVRRTVPRSEEISLGTFIKARRISPWRMSPIGLLSIRPISSISSVSVSSLSSF